jgi:hypothetical protein
MEAITGVFKTRSEAEHALHEAWRTGVPADKITLLAPGTADQVQKEMTSVPMDSTEQPGMGAAVGALMGGGVGVAGGAFLIALIPGLGPVTALGMLSARGSRRRRSGRDGRQESRGINDRRPSRR